MTRAEKGRKYGLRAGDVVKKNLLGDWFPVRITRVYSTGRAEGVYIAGGPKGEIAAGQHSDFVPFPA